MHKQKLTMNLQNPPKSYIAPLGYAKHLHERKEKVTSCDSFANNLKMNKTTHLTLRY